MSTTHSVEFDSCIGYIADTTVVAAKCSDFCSVDCRDKTKVINASDGIACRVLIQNKLLEQLDTFPYLWSLITEEEEEENIFAKKAGYQKGLQPINAGYRTHNKTKIDQIYTNITC